MDCAVVLQKHLLPRQGIARPQSTATAWSRDPRRPFTGLIPFLDPGFRLVEHVRALSVCCGLIICLERRSSRCKYVKVIKAACGLTSVSRRTETNLTVLAMCTHGVCMHAGMHSRVSTCSDPCLCSLPVIAGPKTDIAWQVIRYFWVHLHCSTSICLRLVTSTPKSMGSCLTLASRLRSVSDGCLTIMSAIMGT